MPSLDTLKSLNKVLDSALKVTNELKDSNEYKLKEDITPYINELASITGSNMDVSDISVSDIIKKVVDINVGAMKKTEDSPVATLKNALHKKAFCVHQILTALEKYSERQNPKDPNVKERIEDCRRELFAATRDLSATIDEQSKYIGMIAEPGAKLRGLVQKALDELKGRAAKEVISEAPTVISKTTKGAVSSTPTVIGQTTKGAISTAPTIIRAAGSALSRLVNLDAPSVENIQVAVEAGKAVNKGHKLFDSLKSKKTFDEDKYERYTGMIDSAVSEAKETKELALNMGINHHMIADSDETIAFENTVAEDNIPENVAIGFMADAKDFLVKKGKGIMSAIETKLGEYVLRDEPQKAYNILEKSMQKQTKIIENIADNFSTKGIITEDDKQELNNAKKFMDSMPDKLENVRNMAVDNKKMEGGFYDKINALKSDTNKQKNIIRILTEAGSKIGHVKDKVESREIKRSNKSHLHEVFQSKKSGKTKEDKLDALRAIKADIVTGSDTAKDFDAAKEGKTGELRKEFLDIKEKYQHYLRDEQNEPTVNSNNSPKLR